MHASSSIRHTWSGTDIEILVFNKFRFIPIILPLVYPFFMVDYQRVIYIFEKLNPNFFANFFALSMLLTFRTLYNIIHKIPVFHVT